MKIFFKQLGSNRRYEIEINENSLGSELLGKIKDIIGDNRVRLAIRDEKGGRMLNLYLSKTLKELGIKEDAILEKIGSFCGCCGPFRVEIKEDVDTKKYKKGINLVCLCSNCLKKGEFIYSPELEINKKYNLSEFKIQCLFCENLFELKEQNSKIKLLVAKLSFYQCSAEVVYDDRVRTEINEANGNKIESTFVFGYDIEGILENIDEILNNQKYFKDYEKQEFWLKNIL